MDFVAGWWWRFLLRPHLRCFPPKAALRHVEIAYWSRNSMPRFSFQLFLLGILDSLWILFSRDSLVYLGTGWQWVSSELEAFRCVCVLCGFLDCSLEGFKLGKTKYRGKREKLVWLYKQTHVKMSLLCTSLLRQNYTRKELFWRVASHRRESIDGRLWNWSL